MSFSILFLIAIKKNFFFNNNDKYFPSLMVKSYSTVWYPTNLTVV